LGKRLRDGQCLVGAEAVHDDNFLRPIQPFQRPPEIRRFVERQDERRCCFHIGIKKLDSLPAINADYYLFWLLRLQQQGVGHIRSGFLFQSKNCIVE